MSGPGTPPMNQGIQRLPQGQTRKPLGDDRPPGVLPPGQSREPIQRSDAARRIIAARQLGVDPSKLEQPPGYRPNAGRGDRAAIPAAAPPTRSAAPAQAPAPPPAQAPAPPPAQAAPAETPPAAPSIPLPRARPSEAPQPPVVSRNIADYMSPVPTESVRRAQAMEQALKMYPEGKVPYKLGGWGGQQINPQMPQKAVPPVMATPGAAWGIPIPGNPPAAAATPPQPQVREATPDEIQGAQKRQMAEKMAATKSGGEVPAAQAPRGEVTPPSSQAASPPPPPPQTFRPITGPASEYIVRDPAKEKELEKAKPQKSTKKSSDQYGSNPRYYQILKVPPGDNRAAAQALAKLETRAQNDPQSLSMEEYQLLASKDTGGMYNRSRLPDAVQQFFAQQGADSGKDETGRPKFAQGDQRPPDRVSRTVPVVDAQGQAVPNTTGLVYVPPVRGDQRPAPVDPAVAAATKFIDEKGAPKATRTPTQEGIKTGTERYSSQNIDTDTKVQETEDED